MARTPFRAARIPEDLAREARAAAPELADLGWGQLLRAGLVALTGRPVAEAVAAARMTPGTRRRPDQDHDSAG
jgi:hypothetical protein